MENLHLDHLVDKIYRQTYRKPKLNRRGLFATTHYTTFI